MARVKQGKGYSEKKTSFKTLLGDDLMSKGVVCSLNLYDRKEAKSVVYRFSLVQTIKKIEQQGVK